MCDVVDKIVTGSCALLNPTARIISPLARTLSHGGNGGLARIAPFVVSLWM
jgi:hypothetical protein